MRAHLAEAPKLADHAVSGLESHPNLQLIPALAEPAPGLSAAERLSIQLRPVLSLVSGPMGTPEPFATARPDLRHVSPSPKEEPAAEAPAAFFAASTETDHSTRRRLVRVLGAVAYGSAVNAEQVAAKEASVESVVSDYFSEDLETASNANLRLTEDLRTNVFEILCANSHISISHSQYGPDGFRQFGYSQRAMYANGTMQAKHSVERQRRTGETLSELRIEDGYIDGTARTHVYLERSRVPDPDEMSKRDAEDNGYDMDRRVAKIRLTEVDALGNRRTFTAGVIGVGKDGQAYDARGTANISRQLKLSPASQLATAELENGIWVRKDALPGGIVDVVSFFDDGTEVDAFFGAEGQKGNYETILEESLAREQRVEEELADKVRKLAKALRGSSGQEALIIMAEYAKDFAAEICGEDESYDPAQFGQVARTHIVQARQHARKGDQVAYRRSIAQAKETAEVIMCGMVLRRGKKGMAANGTETETSSLVDSDECDYISKECPLCNAKNARTHETKTKIECKECGQHVKKKVRLESVSEGYTSE